MFKFLKNIETKFWQVIADRIIFIGNHTDDSKIIELLYINGLIIDTYCTNKGIYLN